MLNRPVKFSVWNLSDLQWHAQNCKGVKSGYKIVLSYRKNKFATLARISVGTLKCKRKSHGQEVFGSCFTSKFCLIDALLIINMLSVDISAFSQSRTEITKSDHGWVLILAGIFEWLHNNDVSLDDRTLAQWSRITMNDMILNPSNIIGTSVLLGAIS